MVGREVEVEEGVSEEVRRAREHLLLHSGRGEASQEGRSVISSGRFQLRLRPEANTGGI